VLGKRESQAVCTGCHREFVRPAIPVVVLNCGHFYHRKCLAAVMTAGGVRCGDCSQPLFVLVNP
jgi:hypothetical protein